MILLVTNKEDLTTDYIVRELRSRKLDYFRFNTEDFPTNINLSYSVDKDHEQLVIGIDNREITSDSITSAYLRRPAQPMVHPDVADLGHVEYAEHECMFMIRALDQILEGKWFNAPSSIAKAEFKPFQLKAARRAGFNIPSTLIGNSVNHLNSFIAETNEDLIVKPLGRAVYTEQNEEHVVYANKILSQDMVALGQARYLPSIYQEFIKKRLDLRITVVNRKIFSVAIHSQNHAETSTDWRVGERFDLEHEVYDLPSEIVEQCFSLLTILDLRFGAIDMVLSDDGKFYFLEINPNGQWAWLQERLNLDIAGAIVDALLENNYGFDYC